MLVHTEDGVMLGILVLGVGTDERAKIIIFDLLLVSAAGDVHMTL